ncbi:hypothetical protein BH10CHL1_BH10CHL1_47040 [soil metagenome]
MDESGGVAHSQTDEFDWNNQERLQLLLEAAPIAIVTVDRKGRILYVNTKLEELFGYQRAELLGEQVEMLMPTRFRTTHTRHRFSYTDNPHIRPMGSGMDLAGQHKNGVEFPIEAGLSYINVGNEMVVISSITDISRRKENEALLERRVDERTHELQRRRQVADGLRDILTILNSNRSLSTILEHIAQQANWLLNAEASAIYHIDPHATQPVLQASVGFSVGEASQIDVMLDTDAFRQAILDEQPIIKTEIESPDNPKHGYHVQLTVPIRAKDEIYGGLVLFYRDPHAFSSEDIKVAITVGEQTALAIENARLRTQVEQAAVAAERGRLARDLHDSVTQTLFSASLIAEALPRLWERNSEEGRRRLGELRELTRGALAEMRTLLLELRPATLTEVDLNDLLRLLTEAITARARIPVTLQINGDQGIPPDVKIATYRVAQEALNNVAKHARASSASVTLNRFSTALDLMIVDDGYGFLYDKIAPDHLGLSIMRERADSIGATLTIQSQPEQGTVVTLHWSSTGHAGQVAVA